MYNDEDLDGMTDDALAMVYSKLPDEAKKLNQIAGKAGLLLRQRMEERNATKLDTEHFEGRLASSGYMHEVTDNLALQEALGNCGLTAEELERVRPTPIAPEPSWNQRELNELAKRGGEIRAAIEKYRHSTPNPAKLELKEKTSVPA